MIVCASGTEAGLSADAMNPELSASASDTRGQQLRDSQRRAEVLQGKLEAMAGIEAALPPRPNSGKAVGRGVR